MQHKRTFLTLVASSSLLILATAPQASAHGNVSLTTGDASSHVLVANEGNKNIATFSIKHEFTGSESEQSYNVMDRQYMDMIIPHHREAIAMAELELSRGSSAEVKAMAEKIKMEQIMGLDKATNLYKKVFNAEPPSGTSMTLLPELEKAENVDKTFLRLMIQHHSDGMMMDRKEIFLGRNDEVKQFAREDIPMQMKDIQELSMLLHKLF